MASVSKTFNELVAFTRSTSATYVNSAGYITTTPVTNYLTYSNQPENAIWTKSNSFIQTNLVLWSEDFTNAQWTKGSAGVGVVPVVTANQGVAPDGTLTADRVDFNCVGATNTDRSYIFQNVASTNGIPYASSYYIKAFDAASVGKTIRYTVETGVSSQQVIITLTSEWQRVSNIFPAAGVNYNPLLETRGTVTSSATASVLLWGAQVVQGSTLGDYRATTSAALPILYPDYTGALRARKLCEDATASITHRIFQAQNTSGATSSFSGYFKAGERNWVYLRFIIASIQTKLAYFNLATGTIGTVDADVSATIKSVGNGWYRCTLIGPAINASNTMLIGVTNADNTVTYSGDGTSGIYIADTQMEPNPLAGPYYDTTNTLTYAQRRDYNPVTLASLGLLVEESRTNLIFQSNNFSDTSVWSLFNITFGLNATLSPEGVMNGVRAEVTTSGTTNLYQPLTMATTSYVYSIYAKQGSAATDANKFTIYNITTATNLVALTIDYSTGVVTQTTGSGATAINAGNGWWRIIMPVSTGIAIGNLVGWYACYAGGTETAGEYAYIYGAQLEAGASATSYIPTTTSQLTRAADVANVNTLSPWFNQPGGTLYVEADTSEPSSLAVKNAVAINDNTANNVHRVLSYTGKIGGSTSTAGSFVADLQPLTYTTNVAFKFAYAYAANDFAAVGNGGAPSTDSLGALPTGLITMGLGNFTGVFWNGHIRRITYYPQRLTNAQLQSITT